MSSDKVTVFSSQLGWMALAWRGLRVRALTFGHPDPGRAIGNLRIEVGEPVSADAQMKQLIRRLVALAAGKLGDDLLDVNLDIDGLTPFQLCVTHDCRAIPVGETISYGELALRAGHPGAARAVGRVMSTNRFPLIVPCHRVVAANSLGGFSSPDGLQMKRRLLDAEAAFARPE